MPIISTLTHLYNHTKRWYNLDIAHGMADKLYNLKEVAKILRVSERSVFRYIHSGKLRATKIGYWRISEGDLQRFLERNANVKGRRKR